MIKRDYIYQVFMSHNDEKIGMFNKLKQLENQLDFIQEMGFNAVLCNPIVQSSGDYHGYQIVDYYQIDRNLGTMEDFMSLVHELEKRNMKLYMDFTFCHLSDQSYWYKDYAKGLNNFFITRDYPHDDTWTDIRNSIYEKRNGKYLLCCFNGMMPQLNTSDYYVREEIRKVIHYWMKKSPIINFRADAVYYCTFTEPHRQPKGYCEFLRSCIDEIDPSRQLIGEVWTNHELSKARNFSHWLGNVFNFEDTFNIMNQVNEGKKAEDVVVMPSDSYKRSTYFAGNHDISRVATWLQGSEDKVREVLKALILYTPDNSDFSFYYGTENMFEGLIWDGNDLPVRQPFDVTDMARLIKDKDSLFYYIKDLIAQDKKRRGYEETTKEVETTEDIETATIPSVDGLDEVLSYDPQETKEKLHNLFEEMSNIYKMEEKTRKRKFRLKKLLKRK